MHLVSAVTVTGNWMLSLMASRRRVFMPLPEKGTQKQQRLERNAKGIQAGRRPEEKDNTSASVVSARTFIDYYVIKL